jgi:hypothetical protein
LAYHCIERLKVNFVDSFAFIIHAMDAQDIKDHKKILRVLPNRSVEPTDISKPPETIKTVIPIAMILSIDRLKRVARIFPEVKNIGDNIVIRITAPIIINKIMNS